jgi:MFS family permease
LRQHARRLAWTSAIIHGLVHASVLMLPPLLGDLQRTYRVSLLEILAVANAMYLVYGLAAIPAGFLADRFGSRRMLVASAGGCGFALFLIAGATNFALLAAGLVLLGLCAGVYHPSGLSLLSRGVIAGERGRAIGIHGAGGSLGEALAPTWAGFFALAFHWRIGFLAAGALSFACGVLAATLPAEAGHGHGATGARPSWGETTRALGVTLVGFWKNRRLRWLLGALIAAGFVYRGFLTFLSLHLSDDAGRGVQASYVMSAVLVVGIIAQRYGGELADRRARERMLLLEVALLIPLLLLFAFTSGTAAVVAALAVGFVWALAQPLANALTAAYCRPSCHGLLYGIQFAATFAVGSFATTAGGFLQALGGTRLVFLALALVATLQLGAVAVVVVLTARRSPATQDDMDDVAAPAAVRAESL